MERNGFSLINNYNSLKMPNYCPSFYICIKRRRGSIKRLVDQLLLHLSQKEWEFEIILNIEGKIEFRVGERRIVWYIGVLRLKIFIENR